MEDIIRFFEINLEQVIGTKATHVQISQIIQQARIQFKDSNLTQNVVQPIDNIGV